MATRFHLLNVLLDLVLALFESFFANLKEVAFQRLCFHLTLGTLAQFSADDVVLFDQLSHFLSQPSGC